MMANEILHRGFKRFSKRYGDKYKPVLFHKEVINTHGAAMAGLTIARRKGDPNDILNKMANQIIRKKNKKPGKAKNFADDAGDKAGVKATLISADDKTFKMVERKMQKTFDRSTHGGFGIKVHGVYQVGGMDVYDKHKKNLEEKGNSKFMYHGTDFAAASNIVKTGFLVPKNAKAGRMLGNGVYVTPVSSKAAQYLHDGYNVSRSHGNRGILFVNKCVMGKQFSSPTRVYQRDTPGYDSIFVGKGQHGIMNEEHAIRDPNSVLPTFWVDVEITKP